MAGNVTVDIKEVSKKLAEIANKSKDTANKASGEVADEILRLSSSEVPHKDGWLAGSGHVEQEPGGHIVGYNKVYAARLHEHPEYRFQKGRKGKYLEDPIKHNLDVFVRIISDAIKAIL